MTDSDLALVCVQLASEVGQLKSVIANWTNRRELMYDKAYTTQTETDEWEGKR